MKDKPISPVVFDMLRKMKSARQGEACRLMIAASTYSLSYARALLSASVDGDLLWPRRRPPPPIVTPAGLASMERELKATQENFKEVETAYGNDMVGLAIATRYVATLLERPTIVQFLDENHPEILTELRSILSATSMEDPEQKRTETDRKPPQVNSNRPNGAPNFVPGRGRKWQRVTSRIIDPSVQT